MNDHFDVSRGMTATRLEDILKSFFHHIGRGKSYEFALWYDPVDDIESHNDGPSATEVFMEHNMLLLVTAWLELKSEAAFLTLTNVPLKVFVDAIKRAVEWEGAFRTLRSLSLYVEESPDDDLRIQEYEIMSNALKQTARLQTLIVDVTELTEYEAVRTLRIPGSGLAELKHCSLKNVQIHESDLRSLVIANARQLRYLGLEKVGLLDAGWLDMFKLIGENRLTKCIFYFCFMLDEFGTSKFSNKKPNDSGQGDDKDVGKDCSHDGDSNDGKPKETNITKLCRYLRTGGEFPLINPAVLLDDMTIQYDGTSRPWQRL